MQTPHFSFCKVPSVVTKCHKCQFVESLTRAFFFSTIFFTSEITGPSGRCSCRHCLGMLMICVMPSCKPDVFIPWTLGDHFSEFYSSRDFDLPALASEFILSPLREWCGHPSAPKRRYQRGADLKQKPGFLFNVPS